MTLEELYDLFKQLERRIESLEVRLDLAERLSDRTPTVPAPRKERPTLKNFKKPNWTEGL